MEEKDFIESGILELYILGALSPLERSEVESKRAGSIFIDAEFRRIEAEMELFAIEHQISPSLNLKAKIESKLSFFEESAGASLNDLNLNQTGVNYLAGGNNHTDQKIKELSQDSNLSSTSRSISAGWEHYAFAASVILLCISLAGMYSLYSKLNQSREKYADLLNKNSQYANQVAYFKGEFYRSKTLIDDPDFKKLPLLGTKTHGRSLAVVWWNKKKHTVIIDPNGLNSTDENHSYQLWAISAGKPVDAGVFSVKSDLSSLSQLNDISDAQAFAVTLEPKGGSKSPTMSEMYVMSAI